MGGGGPGHGGPGGRRAKLEDSEHRPLQGPPTPSSALWRQRGAALLVLRGRVAAADSERPDAPAFLERSLEAHRHQGARGSAQPALPSRGAAAGGSAVQCGGVGSWAGAGESGGWEEEEEEVGERGRGRAGGRGFIRAAGD